MSSSTSAQTGSPAAGSGNESATQSAPSLLHGHAVYAKGLVEETIGKVLSSPAWETSGTKDVEDGLSEIKAAEDLSHPSLEARAQRLKDTGHETWLQREGTVEKLLGKSVACGGMVREGEEKQRVAKANSD